MGKVVKLPVDKLVSPSMFRVKYDTGEKVWFTLKGAFIEGRIVSYFAHITPTKVEGLDFGMQIEGGAKPADISNVGYAAEYYVPNPQAQFDDSQPPYIRQVQLLDESEVWSTLDELVEAHKQHSTLKIPEDV